jgi:hypothetical protein
VSSGSAMKKPGVCQLSRSRTNQTQKTGHLDLAVRHAAGFLRLTSA